MKVGRPPFGADWFKFWLGGGCEHGGGSLSRNGPPERVGGGPVIFSVADAKPELEKLSDGAVFPLAAAAIALACLGPSVRDAGSR